MSLVLLLAITCVAEIDLQESTDECVVMWSINERAAQRRRVSLADQTRGYNSWWKVEHKSRRWIEQLSLDETARPERWPKSLSWSKYQPRWHAYLDRAVEWLADPARGNVCRAAQHYGGTPDDGVHADDAAPCQQAKRVRCLARESQAYWNTTPCGIARRRAARARALPARVAAGRSRRR